MERERGREWRNAPTSLVSQKRWDYRGDTRVTSIPFSPILRVILSDVSDIPTLARFAKPQTDPSMARQHAAIRRLFSLAYPPPSPPHHPYPSYARSCRLFAIEATFAGGTVPLGGHAACNAAECRKWNYAKSRGGTMRAETMHEARKRRDGRENVAPSPFIRIADSEARTTVPCFSLAFQNARCATRRKGNYSRDLLLPILSKVQTRLIRLREVTGLGCGEAIVEKSIGGNFDYFFFIRSIRSNNFVI